MAQTDIIVRIKAEGTGEFIKGLKAAEGAVEDVGDEVEKTEKKAESSFKKIGKYVGAAFAVGTVIQFTKALTKLAIDLDATEKKFKTVFGSATKIVEDFAKKNATSLGLTTSEYKKAAAAAGDLLIPLGFQRAEAAKLSSQLVNLSGALSAWTGGQLNAKETADILTKALLGEREQLKTLGINIQEADVKGRLLEKGQAKLTGTTLAQAKATATLELILEKSKDAQAAFADDTKTLAEQQLVLSAGVKQLGENLAETLIPALNDLIGFLNDAVAAYNRFSDRISGRKALNDFDDSLDKLTEYELKVERLTLVLERNALKAKNAFGSSKFINDINKEIEVIDKRLASFRKTGEVIEEVTEKTVKTTEDAKNVFVSFGDAILEIGDRFEEGVTIPLIQSLILGDDPDATEQEIVNRTEDILKRVNAERRDALRTGRIEMTEDSLEVASTIGQEAFNVFVGLQQAELQILENKFQQGLISEKEYQSQRAKLQEKEAKAAKANAIFETTINIAASIAKAFTKGPIIGQILAGISAAAGAAQLAIIAKTPIPKFAKGTKGKKKAPKGMKLVGEEGPELIMDDGGYNILTATDSQEIMKILGGYGMPVQFNTDNTMLNTLDLPMKTLKEINKESQKSGIDLRPLLNASDRQRLSVGKKLDRIHEAIVKQTGHRMTRS